jgi:uncharacterized glyoxalase superfamily protein PhnB
MVEDVAATIDWYERALDAETIGQMPEGSDDPEWAQVRIGEVSIMFQQRASLEADLPSFEGTEIGASMTLYIDADDVRALYDELAGGADVALELRETAYGRREFAVTDPNGYVLWFGEKV